MRTILLFLLGLSVSCNTTTAQDEGPAGVESTWAVTVIRTGGVAGIINKTIIRDDGMVQRSKNRHQLITSRVSQASIQSLNEAIDGLPIGKQGKTASSGPLGGIGACRDCIFTTLIVNKNSKQIYYNKIRDGQSRPPEMDRILTLVNEILKQ